MRVCLVTEFFYPDRTGSTPTLLSDLMRQLKDDHGVEFDVVTSRNLYRTAGAKLPAYEEWNGSRIVRVGTPATNRLRGPLRPLGGALFAAAATRAMMRLRDHYDLVIVGSNPPAAPQAAMAFQRKRGTPYVYLIHDLYPDIAVGLKALRRGSAPERLGRRLQRTWLSGAAKVIVTGRSIRDYVVSEYGVPSENVAAIPLWADDAVVNAPPAARRFKEEHARDRFLVMYFGTIGPLQSVGLVVDAAKLAQDSNPEVLFAIIGAGSEAQEIANRLERERVGNVEFVPGVESDRAADLLASADASLVPVAPGMDRLCTPIKFYSILASRRPVIAAVSPQSEIGQVIAETGCGFTVDAIDAAGMAEAVVKLSSDSELARRMGEAGRTALEERFTLPVLAREYYNVLASVAARNGDGSKEAPLAVR